MSAVDELAVVKPKLSYQMAQTRDDNVQEILKSQSSANAYGNRHNNPPIEPFGGNQPHNNMPPYYTLAFIMKL